MYIFSNACTCFCIFCCCIKIRYGDPDIIGCKLFIIFLKYKAKDQDRLGDPCMPNFMVDPKTLQCTGLIDLGRLGTADRYADLALMIANAEENWAAPDEAERAFAVLFNVLGIEAPDRERLAFYLRLDPLTWG